MSSNLGISMCEKCEASAGYIQGIRKSSISYNSLKCCFFCMFTLQ